MNYNKKTVRDVDVAGKKVLLRCDFNVPQDKETGAITSDKRIVAALPTIQYLLDNGAAVIACSHLGKPPPPLNPMPRSRRKRARKPPRRAGRSPLRSCLWLPWPHGSASCWASP